MPFTGSRAAGKLPGWRSLWRFLHGDMANPNNPQLPQRPGRMRIRDFIQGEESVLHAVFYSSVHELARGEYERVQLEAWAPRLYDATKWGERIRKNRPFVAEIGGTVAGFADLQVSGHIDLFFVSAQFAGRGVGGALMEHIHRVARRRRISALTADVSLTAEPFFARYGFVVERRKVVVVNGVPLRNARMRKNLDDALRSRS